ncbi:MAG: prephenate dehydrogenase [Rikenellaceae bacterium]
MIAYIIGVGLIGGSFALSLKETGICERVLGSDSSADNITKAFELGLIDEAVSIEQGVERADLIVLAIPVDALPTVAIKVLNRVKSHQTVIDMGSIKEDLCEIISMHVNRSRFVATHPMWGTEHSGPTAAQHNAFKGRNVVICEKGKSAVDAVAMVEDIYTKIGMPISYMEAEEHDLHVAYISHISHITSFALALTVLEKEREEQRIFELAGGGFESTVRLAKSASATWVPILLHNKFNVLDVLREHIHQLQIMRKALESDDAEQLTQMMAKANSIQKILNKL